MKNLVLGMAAAGLCATTVLAEPKGLGVGVMVGEPTGVSIKKWLDATHAIDGGAAWSIAGEDALSLHADYLFHRSGFASNAPPEGMLHYGVGARVHIRSDDEDNGNGHDNDEDDVALGVRLPVGLTYPLKDSSMEFFMELAPVVELLPDTDADVDAAFGIRFYFR